MKNRIISFILALTLVVSSLFGTAVFAGAEGEAAKLEGTDLNLAENITVRMYVSVANAAEGDYAIVTLPDGTSSKTLLADAEKSGNSYLFYAEVAVKDFAKDITLEIYSNDEVVYTTTTTAKAYCENYKVKYPSGEFLPLIASLEVYAAAAAAYFDGAAAVTVDADLSAVPAMERAGTMPAGITHRSATLVLESETTVRHYFEIEEGRRITEYTFFVDLDGDGDMDPDEKLPALKKQTGNGSDVYYVDVAGITPNELDVAYTIGVVGGGNEYFCTYGALTYAKSKASSSSALANLVKALYNYNTVASELAADVYFDGTLGMSYEYGVTTPIVNPVTKANSTFMGWADENGNIVTEIPASAKGDIYLTSAWSDGANIHHYGFDYNKLTGANYCTNHVDTDGDDKCNACNCCIDITACGVYTNTKCNSCSRSRDNYVTVGNIEWGSKSAAVCAYPVTLGNGKATLFALNGSGTKYSVAASTGLCGILFGTGTNAKTNAIALDLTLGMPSAEQIADAKDSALVFGAVPEKYIKMGVQFGHSSRFNLFGISDDGYVTVLDVKVMKLSEGLNSFRVVIDTSAVSNDGVKNDTIYVKLYDADGNLVTSKSTELPTDISAYTRANDVFRMDFNDSGYLLIDEFKITALPLVTNTVVYPTDATLPADTATTFTPGERLPLAEWATKSGYEFAGWYADAELTKPINEVPENAVGAFEVYAKWVRPILNADYHTNQVVGSITHLPQGRGSYKIENGYLLWETTAENPVFYTSNTPLANIGSKQITFTFEFADAGTEKDMSVGFRFKDGNNVQYEPLTISNGIVKLDGKEVATLSETEFAKVTLVVDFEKNEVRLTTSEGYEVYTKSYDFPDQSVFTKGDLYSLRAASAGAIKIGSIKVYAGDLLAD